MTNKLFAMSLTVLTLFFVACGNDEAESALKAQQNLDKGNFTNTITSLESKSVKTDEDYMILASAYMGKAGLSLPQIISAMSNDSTANSDEFATFVQNIVEKRGASTLEDLQKAADYYNSIATAVIESKALTIESEDGNITVGDRDLYLGLSLLSKVAITLSYLGDVTKLHANGEPDNEMVASACAITKVYAPNASLPSECSLVQLSPYEGNQKVTVTLSNGQGQFERLANATGDELYLTDYKNPLTPITVDEKQVTIQDILIETINDAFALVDRIAPDDVKADIAEFKNEIGLENGQVTANTISKYLAEID